MLVSHREILARAIHEDYVRAQLDGGVTFANSSLVPWDRLTEDLKDSSRRQADHIGAKLREIGCDVGEAVGAGGNPFSFSPKEVEVLAEMEHVRWHREREEAGWIYGPRMNEQEKESPNLVPWTNLPEHEREKDRNAVRRIPPLLAKVGLRVVRMQEKA